MSALERSRNKVVRVAGDQRATQSHLAYLVQRQGQDVCAESLAAFGGADRIPDLPAAVFQGRHKRAAGGWTL
jgi:hypothetical protein